MQPRGWGIGNRKRWRDLWGAQRTAIGAAASVQVLLAAGAR
jgi:hypothetical protein